MFNENFDFAEASEIRFTPQKLGEHSRKIHENAVSRAEKYLVAEAELLNAIIQVDLDETYRKLGFAYLTPYCEKHLGLSTDVAAIFVRVARKSHEVPALQQAVDLGLSVTKAKTIASVVTADNHQDWIEKAQILTKEKLEKEVAKANPTQKKPERVKPTGENRTRIEFELNDEEMLLQKRALDLISRKLGKSASLAEAQKVLLEDYVNRHDPVKKAERAARRKSGKMVPGTQCFAQSVGPAADQSRDRSGPMTGSESLEDVNDRPDILTKKSGQRSGTQAEREAKLSSEKSSRAKVSAAVKHAVNQRDNGECQAELPDGTLCRETRWVEHHHLIPISQGGTDTPENLMTLCSAHHRMWHERELGT